MQQALIDAFEQHFARRPRFEAGAPGRVNLIGEHTDYNDGFVLPMAIDRRTTVVADTNDSSRVRVASAAMGEAVSFDLNDPIVPSRPGGPGDPGEPAWANYVKGVVAGCIEKGMSIGGFDAWIDSTVPVGGGLSSSAALEVAVATLMEQLSGQVLDPVDKALLCQRAEHDYARMPCGIMDQFIAVMGQAGHALLIDCRSREVRHVAMADPHVAVLIINSNVKHDLGASEYPLRRSQCEDAAKALNAASLREVSMKQLVAAKAEIDPVVYRRAYHVIGENARTLQAADEIEARSWWSVGRLMLKSHASLRDNFEVSCAELDLLVDLAKQRVSRDGGVYGSRMTGGGFGGCTVSLVYAQRVDEIAGDICSQYEKQTGITPSSFATVACGR